MHNRLNHLRARGSEFPVLLQVVCTLIAAGSCLIASPQTSVQPAAPPQERQSSPIAAAESLKPNYVLGVGDQIVINAFEVEELSGRPFRIDGDGYINLPLIGRIQAAGKSVEEFQNLLTEALKKYVRQPQVSVTVTQFRSEPVFFVGAFKSPGIYPLQGQRTLLETLSSVGGLTANASRRIKVTRRKEYGAIPLPNVQESADGKFTSVTISLGSLQVNINPAEDIVLKPFDIISVERAEMIYMNGEVGHVGGLELDERQSLSIVQALTMAGGLTHDADPKKAYVLRPVLNSARRAEIPVDVKQILIGKQVDFPLLPNDLLYIPRGRTFRSNLLRGITIGVPIATGIALLATRL